MLSIIPVFSFLIFGALYPLCFWFSLKPISKDFHKFHIGLPNFIAGIGVVILFFLPVPLWVKWAALGWKIIFLSVSKFYWKKPDINRVAVSAVSVLGIGLLGVIHVELIGISVKSLPVTVLGGLVLCAALYAMNLGHHYLNVPGLPVSHLIRATKVLGALLALRIFWDGYCLLQTSIVAGGEIVVLYRFLTSLDGFFLNIAFFFGTLLPLSLIYFVLGTLKVKSTQSATGILYVLVVSVLMGDLAYKYYAIQFGMVL